MVRLRPEGGDKVAHLAWAPQGAAIAVGTEDGGVSLIDLAKADG
jgi:hypothetical protein